MRSPRVRCTSRRPLGDLLLVLGLLLAGVVVVQVVVLGWAVGTIGLLLFEPLFCIRR